MAAIGDSSFVRRKSEEDALAAQPSSNWDEIPNELLVQIFSYLSVFEVLRSALVCKKWNACSSDGLFWRKKAVRPQKENTTWFESVREDLKTLSLISKYFYGFYDASLLDFEPAIVYHFELGFNPCLEETTLSFTTKFSTKRNLLYIKNKSYFPDEDQGIGSENILQLDSKPACGTSKGPFLVICLFKEGIDKNIIELQIFDTKNMRMWSQEAYCVPDEFCFCTATIHWKGTGLFLQIIEHFINKKNSFYIEYDFSKGVAKKRKTPLPSFSYTCE